MSACPGCGDVLGTNPDICVECSVEVAFGDECRMCGWGIASNPTNCGECAEAAGRVETL